MAGSEPGEDSPLESVAAGAGVLAGGLVAVLLLAAGVDWWWMGFPLIGGFIPLFVGVARYYESSEGNDSAQEDALAALRTRYARGELTEAEFERRVERLLETEDVPTARETVERSRERESEEV